MATSSRSNFMVLEVSLCITIFCYDDVILPVYDTDVMLSWQLLILRLTLMSH